MNENEARTTEEAEEAKRWVEERLKDEDGCLYGPEESVLWLHYVNPQTIDLQGSFTAAELRALADYMEQHSKEGRATTHAGKGEE